MLLWTLSEIESAVRSSWCRKTCDPAQTVWSEDNPARGQCAVTALVLHDMLGGEVLVADAWNADGSRQGFHYWNRLAGGVELDLTREQFFDGESLSRPEVAPIPEDRTTGRLASQYQRLASAVHLSLVDGAGDRPWPDGPVMDEPRLSVRARRESDLDALVQLLALTHREKGYPVNGAYVRADFIASPGEIGSWVAVSDDELVGHIALLPPRGSQCTTMARRPWLRRS